MRVFKPTKLIYTKPQSIIKECKILTKSAVDRTPELLIFSPKENHLTMYNLEKKRQVGSAYINIRETCIYVADLFINKFERGKGYGRKFLDYIQNLSKANGKNGKINLFAALQNNEQVPPHLFYAKYGFKANDRIVQKKIDAALKENKPLPKYINPVRMFFEPDNAPHCGGSRP